MPNPPPSNAAYFDLIKYSYGVNSTLPDGWRPLAAQTQANVGFVGNAYYHETTGQIVITIDGPASLQFGAAELAGARSTNLKIMAGIRPESYEQAAANFVGTVQDAAQNLFEPLSIATDNIFVTGLSLGGYGAQHLGLTGTVYPLHWPSDALSCPRAQRGSNPCERKTLAAAGDSRNVSSAL